MTKLLATIVGLVLLCITNSKAIPVNPECQGLQNLAQHLEAVTAHPAIKTTGVKNVNCNVFRNCSGLWCTGNMQNDNFNGSLYLEHCSDPVKILMHLKVPNQKVDEWRVFENGKTNHFQVPVPQPFGTVPLTVTPSFSRNGSFIVVKLSGCAEVPLLPKPICNNLAATSIQVSRKACPTEKPGKKSTRQPIKTSPKPTRSLDKSTKSKTTNELQTKTPTTKSTGKPHPTAPKPKRTGKSTPIRTTKKNPKAGKIHTSAYDRRHQGSQKSGSHGLSVGSKVAIVVSVILLCLLVLGLFVYWRKVKRRGPMYYNDIFVNRESNTGIDDDEPLFDSHLVL